MSNNISYTEIASIILKEVNKIREYPRSFVSVLRERINKYD